MQGCCTEKNKHTDAYIYVIGRDNEKDRMCPREMREARMRIQVFEECVYVCVCVEAYIKMRIVPCEGSLCGK